MEIESLEAGSTEFFEANLVRVVEGEVSKLENGKELFRPR